MQYRQAMCKIPQAILTKLNVGRSLGVPGPHPRAKFHRRGLSPPKSSKCGLFVINFGVDSIPDVDLRHGRGSIFYNPTQPIPSVYRPNPTDNWCRHSWPDQIQPNSKHQHNALVVAKHNCKYPKMQKYASHQFRHNHNHYQHNLIQWPIS